MSKRVSFAAVNFLTALSKVCSSSRNCSHSSKVFYSSLKHPCTATATVIERSDSQNPTGYQIENFSQGYQIPTSGFNSYTGYEQRLNPGETLWENPAHDYYATSPLLGQNNGTFSGFHRQDSSAYRQSFANENHNSNTVGKNANRNGYYYALTNYNNNNGSDNTGAYFQQSTTCVHHKHNGVYRENTINNLQNKPLQLNPRANVEQYPVLTNPKPETGMESAKDEAPNSEYIGTIEDLDEFIKQGNLKEAVKFLGCLEDKGVPVDLPRFLHLMHACGEAEALEEARVIHEHIMRSVSPLKVSIYNKILEMYSKCGSMDDAFHVFNEMPERNLTTWDTMITWFAKNGLGEDAIDMFTRFKKAELKPDGPMFIGVFSACSVVGDIDEGLLHFQSMCKDYGIIPSMEHYVSVVHMLGSTGHLDEALEFIEKMPVEPTVDIWETLMNLGRIHGNLELGDRCAEIVEQLDSSRLNEQSKAGLVPVKAIDLAKEGQKKKLASKNPLEIRSRVHEYRAGDTSHPENDRIYALLRGLREQMKEKGYIPETRFVLHDIDQESKEDALLAHSERLASAQGFLTSPARSPIRVIKNLRVCGDCHNAMKIISKIVGRELIMRDAKRFHHFKDGVCSCRDYW